jgi:uncharacterized protein (DUF362 family)
MIVSLLKFDGSLDSLRRAIEMCGGFDKLRRDDRVLIKPNNCFRHRITPPYGMVTTSKIIDGIVRLLLEYGCKDISIGEGAIIDLLDDLKPYTRKGFKGTGIDKVAQRHNVKLIDFNEGPFVDMDLEGEKVQVAKAALDAGFLINVPVLKTHFQTRISMGFKNLKGCLSKASKKKFHNTNRLDFLICLLNESIKSDLILIDGIYMLEKGPETLVGKAYRKDIIIAGTDVFNCDTVGASVLGIDPSQVGYLREFAKRHNRSFDIRNIPIKGEDIESCKESLQWQFEPDKELLAPANISGLKSPSPGQTLCCGCAATLALALSIFGKDNPNMDFGDARLYYGKELYAENDAKNVFLYGNCGIKSNKSLQNAVRIEGCPPTLTTTLIVLMRGLLSKPRALKLLLIRAVKLMGIKLGIYSETFPGWDRYRLKEFDETHFWLRK